MKKWPLNIIRDARAKRKISDIIEFKSNPVQRQTVAKLGGA